MQRLLARLFSAAASLLAALDLLAADAPKIELAAYSTNGPVRVPFELRRGHIMVPATVHGTNKLSLLLDTGYGMTMLHPVHAEAFALRPTGRSVTIVGIAGEEQAAQYEGPSFDFGGVEWKPRRVAALTGESPGRSRRRDGILGSGFFRRFVVEIDSRRNSLLLHEPEGFQPAGTGETLPLTFKSTTPIVEAVVRLEDGSTVRGQFEIDTGCDGGLCLGRHFVEAHRLVSESASANGGRTGVGGTARIRSGHLPEIRLGRLSVEKPSANFFLENSPVDAPLAGHIGWELLRRFKVTFDYTRKRMILDPVP